ncbi:MAG: MFS transporter [Proteobacteria bacterium]|nr:MFS transporter [Pseudomonadota bacterium]
MCLGQVANLLSHVAVPAVMARHLIPLWHLSAAEAGSMAGAYSLGYMLAVPMLMTLTDRIDARLILIGGSAVMGAATVGFGLFADSFFSATVLWALAGMGCAGAYMPGLRALTDRLGSGDHSRPITLYTSCFSLGVGLSFLTTQVLGDTVGWRWAFVLTGLAPLVMIAVCLFLEPKWPVGGSARLLRFGEVVRNREAMSYIIGYGVHCFELYGFRTWLVAFWTYIAARNSGGAYLSPVMVSVLVTIFAVPASILGNEAALRLGRRRSISWVMGMSSAVALMIATLVSASPLILLALLAAYAFTLPGDSGALTSGMTLSARPDLRGATMALHSMMGFGLAAAGGTLVGIAIDAAGGPSSDAGWTAGFLVMGLGIATGPLAMRTLARSRSG